MVILHIGLNCPVILWETRCVLIRSRIRLTNLEEAQLTTREKTTERTHVKSLHVHHRKGYWLSQQKATQSHRTTTATTIAKHAAPTQSLTKNDPSYRTPTHICIHTHTRLCVLLCVHISIYMHAYIHTYIQT